MFNILYISHERKMGGANVCLLELADEMQRRGHKVVVSVLYAGCPIDIELRKRGIKTIVCPLGWWQVPVEWGGVYRALFKMLNVVQHFFAIRLCNYVKKNRIDIIHSNSSVINLGMYVAQRTHVKHIWHFREFEMPDCGLTYLLGRKKSIEYVNKSDKVIFISKALRASYMDILDEKTCVVYDGVADKYTFTTKKHNVESCFLIAGNLNPNKNQMLVLKATKILKDRGITNFSVKIAGESTSLQRSKQYKKELIEFIELNMLDNVEMLGYISDINGIRETTDVEIVASVSEAFGRVTIEGMLAHNPVIVSNVGASPELVENGKMGLIFENEDAEDLADKIEFFIKNSCKVMEMGEYAFQKVKDKYTLENCVNNILDVYEEVLTS